MASGPSAHSLTLELLIKEKIPGLLGKIKGEFGILGSAIHLVTDLFKSFNKAAMTIGATIFLGTLLAITKLVKMVFNLNEQIAVMGQRFGMNKNQVKLFSAQIFEASAQAGIMADQTAAVADALINAGFKGSTKDMLSLSTSIYKFSEVTGLSIEVGAEFSAQLSKMGYSSDTLIRKMTGLRNALQLSAKELESIIRLATQAATSFYLFGGPKNQARLDAQIKGLTDLAAIMSHMGMPIEEVTGMLSELTDPIKFLDSDFAKRIGYNMMDIKRLTRGGMLDVSSFLMDLKKKTAQFGNLDNWEMMMGLERRFGPEKAKLLKMVQQFAIEDLNSAVAKNQEQKDSNELFMEMGRILKPLQKEWMKFVSQSMPLIQGIVEFLTDILKFITPMVSGFAEWNKQLGGAPLKMFLMAIVGGGFALGIGKIIKSIFGMGTAIKTVAGETEILNTAMKGGITLATKMKAAGILGGVAVGMSVFAKKSWNMKDIANICLSAGLFLGTTPIGWTLMGIGALIYALDWVGNKIPKLKEFINQEHDLQAILGKRSEALASADKAVTDNISKASSQISQKQLQNSERSIQLWEKIARDITDMTKNTQTTNQVIDELTGTVRHESAKDRNARLNSNSAKSSALASSE